MICIKTVKKFCCEDIIRLLMVKEFITKYIGDDNV